MLDAIGSDSFRRLSDELFRRREDRITPCDRGREGGVNNRSRSRIAAAATPVGPARGGATTRQ
jgi:hypothetical protein